MQELIPIQLNQNQEPVVSGRELHELLGVKTKFKDWFPRMCEYGFSENLDYTPLIFEHPQNKQPVTDYVIKLDMAKEISMLQRNEQGKKVRQYFIEVEKEYNSPEKIMARALRIAENTINNLTLENKQQKQQLLELKPKADYTDLILNNKSLVTITQIAKDYGMSGNRMNDLLHSLGVQYKQSGQWLLYSKHQRSGYTHSETVPIKHKDGKETVKMNTKWTQKGRLFIYDLLKRNGYLPLIEQ